MCVRSRRTLQNEESIVIMTVIRRFVRIFWWVETAYTVFVMGFLHRYLRLHPHRTPRCCHYHPKVKVKVMVMATVTVALNRRTGLGDRLVLGRLLISDVGGRVATQSVVARD